MFVATWPTCTRQLRRIPCYLLCSMSSAALFLSGVHPWFAAVVIVMSCHVFLDQNLCPQSWHGDFHKGIKIEEGPVK